MRSLLALSLLSFALPTLAHEEGHQRDWPAERLEYATDAEGIVNTDWAGVPDHFGLDVGLLVGYENNPLFTFTVPDGKNPLERQEILVEHRVMSSVWGSIALFNWLQIGLDLPVLLTQSRDDAQAPELDTAVPLGTIGIGDIGVHPKLRLLRQQDDMPLDVAFIAPVTLPTGQFADYFGEEGFTITPGIAFSREWEATTGTIRAAANIGHRFREPTESFGVVLGNEMIVRVAGAYRLKSLPEFPTEVGVSLSVAAATDSAFRGDNSPVRNPVELLGEVQQKVWGPFDAFLGGGVGIVSGYGVPDARVFAGLAYADRPEADYDEDGMVSPQDRCPKRPETVNGYKDDDGCPDPGDDDKDGIENDVDKCKDVPEDKDDFEDSDGCPDDDDADGIADDVDGEGGKCRKDAEDKDGFEDEDGCPDLDNDKDGVEDKVDACVNDPEDKDDFEDQDGCPDADNDKDTLLDPNDQCPNEAGPPANKGCPDKDRDGDTVVDRLDNCPDEAGPPDNGGCAQKQLVVLREQKIEILDKIFFRTNSDVIQKKSYPLLDNIVAVMKAHPEITKVRVEGHTDNVGEPDYNKDLSGRRAASVRKYLVEHGIEEARLDAVGYGMEKPIATNDTDEGKSQNRRVEFMIVE